MLAKVVDPDQVGTETFCTGQVSVADPDPESGGLLTPGSGMNIPDHIFESLETFF